MTDFSSLFRRTDAYQSIKRDKAQGRLSHAYLLLCSDGDNLERYLKKIAKLIACPNDGFDDCRVCKLIEDKVYPDVVFYPKDGDSVTSEEITSLIADSYVKPYESDKKIFLISNAQKMNASSQNKLLKTLEEPPKNVHIILGATGEFSLLPTVRSRVKKISILPFSAIELKDALSSQCPDVERLENAIACGDGTVGKTLALYNDDALQKAMEIAEDIIVNMQSSKDVLEYSEKITRSKIELLELLNVLSLFFRDMSIRFEGQTSLVVNKAICERLMNAQGFTRGALINIQEDVLQAVKRLEANGNKTWVQEWLLFKILEEKFKWQKL